MIVKLISIYKRVVLSRVEYYRWLGVSIGSNCDIQKVNFGSEPYLVTVGNHVQITEGTKIFTHGGAWVLRLRDPKIDFFGKVFIGDNVYIGNNSLILPGVTIGKNAIIAAGSVVTKSIDENCIVGGNPARVIGNVDEFYHKIKQYDVGTKGLCGVEKRKFLLGLSEENFIKK